MHSRPGACGDIRAGILAAVKALERVAGFLNLQRDAACRVDQLVEFMELPHKVWSEPFPELGKVPCVVLQASHLVGDLGDLVVDLLQRPRRIERRLDQVQRIDDRKLCV